MGWYGLMNCHQHCLYSLAAVPRLPLLGARTPMLPQAVCTGSAASADHCHQLPA